MFFDSWDSLFRILVVGIAAYVGLIIILRISGKRTLTKMNSFDLIVTIALGSTLSSGILQKNVALADTLFAITLLVALQFIISWLAVHSKKANRLLKSEPTLLYRSGHFLESAMKQVRISEDEIRSAARDQGFDDLAKVGALILETNGQISAVGDKEIESRGTPPAQNLVPEI